MTCSVCRRSLAYTINLPNGQPACRRCAEQIATESLRTQAFWSLMTSAAIYLALGLLLGQVDDRAFHVVASCMYLGTIVFGIVALVRG